MARQKVKLAFIENKVKRKTTYKKRVDGFMAKVSALSTLCGINACAIVYSLLDDPVPKVWPNDLGVHYVISQFSNMSLMDKTKNMQNQVSFMRHRIAKINEQIRKKKNENREKRITELMWKCLVGKTNVFNLSRLDLDTLGRHIELKLIEINNRMEALKSATTLQQVSYPSLISFAEPRVPMALQQVGPLPTQGLPQPLMPMAVQQVAPSLPDAETYPWIVDWVNQPADDIGFGQVVENQVVIPAANQSLAPWSNGSFGQVWANPPPNPHGP